MGFPCPNCQTELQGTERFCRKCGTRILPEDLLEAQTRSFEEGPQAQPQPAPEPGAPLGGPREYAPSDYVPPHYVPPQAAPASQLAQHVYYPAAPVAGGLESPPRPKTNWQRVLGIALLIFVVVCGAGGVFLYQGYQKIKEELPEMSSGEEGFTIKKDGNEVTILTNPSRDKLAAEVAEWYYPKSEPVQQMKMRAPEGSHVSLMMKTSDAVDDVLAYYKERVPSDARISIDKESKQGVIKFGSTVITAQPQFGLGSKTDTLIMVIVGEAVADSDFDIPEIPEMPEPPVPPGPPPPPPR